MVTYSTNWMGPVSIEWYRERGLTHVATKTVRSELVAELMNLPVGAEYKQEDLTEYYCGGRIDIYGLSEEDYYCGKDEYGIGIMKARDWAEFGDWLDELNTEELESYEWLIENFENHYGQKISWAPKL